MRRLTPRAYGGMALAVALLSTLSLATACATDDDGVRVEGTPTDFASARPPDQAEPWDTEPPAASDAPPSAGTGRDTDGGAESGEPDGADGSDGSAAPTKDDAAYTAGNDGDGDEAHRVDDSTVITVLRRDPKVSKHVKRGLVRCDDDRYPVGVEYGRVTGGAQVDLVVNVSSCTDSVGVGTYVYRRSTSGTLVNVFAAERPPVFAKPGGGGMLVVTRDIYIGDEPLCCPSGRDVITYQWRDGVFQETGRERTDGETRPGAPAQER